MFTCWLKPLKFRQFFWWKKPLIRLGLKTAAMTTIEKNHWMVKLFLVLNWWFLWYGHCLGAQLLQEYTTRRSRTVGKPFHEQKMSRKRSFPTVQQMSTKMVNQVVDLCCHGKNLLYCADKEKWRISADKNEGDMSWQATLQRKSSSFCCCVLFYCHFDGHAHREGGSHTCSLAISRGSGC